MRILKFLKTGITIPKDLLEKIGFHIGDSIETHIYNGRLILFKKPMHHSRMKFQKGKNQLNSQDLNWLEVDMVEAPEKDSI